DGRAGPARAAVHVELRASAPPRHGARGPGDLARRAMTEAVLRADGLHKRYGELEVLRGVSFEVGRGQVKVIIGPSGSGKSTLLRCLCLLEPPDAGTVSLEGRPPRPGEVGMVFQRFNLFLNMTALGYVTCGLTEVRL